MTAVIAIPSSLDDLTFETVLERLAAHSPDEKVILDARHTSFATPFGLTALLTLAQSRVEKPEFIPPEAQTSSLWQLTRVSQTIGCEGSGDFAQYA